MSAKGKFARLLSNLMLERAVVAGVDDLGGFTRVQLRCEVPPFSPGAKVQLLLPSDDMRTYTPIAAADGIVLLGWKHASGPGAAWMANPPIGEPVQFLGPQRSLDLAPGPVVLVGDETSVAVAAAYAIARPGQVHAVIQVASAVDARAAGASVGLDHVDVITPDDTAATVDAVTSKLARIPDATVALTGGSAIVVSVRDALRRAGMRRVKAKAYWVPGRTGLD